MQQGKTVCLRHHEIQEDHVKVFFTKEGKGIPGIFRKGNLHALRRKGGADGKPYGAFVVDDQNGNTVHKNPFLRQGMPFRRICVIINKLLFIIDGKSRK